jgi:hypothetical protein
MLILSLFGVVLLGLGVELIREGIVKNTQFRPRYLTRDGDKEIIVGIFILMAGISLILTLIFV